ncbi:MAG: hypothetical protein INR71_08960, partial [Terriglobus roseus]|nr:hypothetical protein [Terriglobus roseus]
ADVRAQRPLLFADGATDPVGEAIEADRVQGQACRLLGLMGASAHVDPRERASLRDKGLSEREVDQIDAVARRHARAEDARDWLIGPERAVLIYHLDASGIAPTDTNIRRLRASALCLMAELLERTADRYAVVASHVGDIAAEIMREPDPLPRPAETPILSRVPDPIRPECATEVAVQPSVTEGQNTPKPAEDVRAPASFIGLVEALARSKTNPKARAWDVKTARQHLSIARLFAKVARTDDPRQMTQAHVGAYISLLSRLPTHWGKSSDDADRSIDEITARVEDLDDDEIGLTAPTINRHRTQLSTILAHLEENGYPIGTVSRKSVAKDDRSPDEKRCAFSVEEGRKLMAGAPWSLVDQTGKPIHPPLRDTDAQFWVFLVAWYMMMRLGEVCGLLISEIDLSDQEIEICHNKLRRVKNKSSIRTLSIHPELLRIGFGRYVEHQKALGHEALFPELYGSATAATVKFNKEWVQVLDAALPEARQQRKTMHSTRKGGNSAMIDGKIIDAIRYYMLGHVKSDVHGKHYFEKPTHKAMLDAYAYIPIITDNMPELK